MGVLLWSNSTESFPLHVQLKQTKEILDQTMPQTDMGNDIDMNRTTK